MIDYEVSAVRRMRAALRCNEAVVAAITGGWQSLPKDSNGYLRQPSYTRLHVKVSQSLLGLCESEAEQYAEEDWQEDAVMGGVMPYDSFLDAMFQLADLWTDEIFPAKYAQFLDRVFSADPNELGCFQDPSDDEECAVSKVRVGTSKIHGRGVFATEQILQGERIIEYRGERISKEEGSRRSNQHEVLTYIFQLNEVYDVDGDVDGNDARYINHSCKPNAVVDISQHADPTRGRIHISALQKIESGDEIVYNYELDGGENLKCTCGAPGCKGVMAEA